MAGLTHLKVLSAAIKAAIISSEPCQLSIGSLTEQLLSEIARNPAQESNRSRDCCQAGFLKTILSEADHHCFPSSPLQPQSHELIQHIHAIHSRDSEWYYSTLQKLRAPNGTLTER